MQLTEVDSDVENTGNNENAEMDNMLCDLIDIHIVKGNEEALKRVLQSIYSMMDNSNNDIRFGTTLIEKLIFVVIDEQGNLKVSQEQVAKVLDAVQVHVHQLPWLGIELLRKLSLISLSIKEEQRVELHPHAGQILDHMLEDFVRVLGLEYTCSPRLFTVIRQLLQSELSEYRKLSYSIMRKLLTIIQKCEDNTDIEKDSLDRQEILKCIEPHWSAYIVIMEQLEQQESHLVLPMLSGQLPRFVANSQYEDWLSWLRILYVRLLFNKNILVVRWSLENFLINFSIHELRRVNLLTEFMDAINKTELYDVDLYLLPEQNIKTFIQSSGTLHFLEALVLVPWHSLPLLHWLRSMQPRQPLIAKTLLLKVSERIKSMQHENLRYEAQNRIFEVFENTIDSLLLVDYIQFIKALCHNFSRDQKRFANKIASCKTIADDVKYFDKHLCMMIFRADVHIGIELHKQVSLLPKLQHGWWRLFCLFFSLKLEYPNQRMQILDFYRKEYDLNIDVIEQFTDLNDLQQYLIDKLNCVTEEEISFILRRSVDWFACEKILKWKQIEEFKLLPLDLLNQGTIVTAQRIAFLLDDIDDVLKDENIIRLLKTFLKEYPDSTILAKGLVKYASTHLPIEDSDQILSEVLEATQFLNISVFLNCTNSVPTSLLIKGILSGSPLSNEKCIEYVYLINQFNYFFTSCRKRDSYTNFVTEREGDINLILNELLRLYIEVIEKNRNCVENSKEHRFKIRVARALLRITFKNPAYWSDQLWIALLAPNVHDNIKYMYECLVARCVPSVDMLLKQLHQFDSLQTSQQLSFISVLHIYCLNKYSLMKLEQLQIIIDALLPQTMCKDIEVRVFTQLVLHRLLQQFEDTNIKLPGITTMKMAIEANLGEKPIECQHEGRLLLPKICYQTPDNLQIADFILYMTNAPCDEYFADSLRPNIKLKVELDKFRSTYKYKGVVNI